MIIQVGQTQVEIDDKATEAILTAPDTIETYWVNLITERNDEKVQNYQANLAQTVADAYVQADPEVQAQVENVLNL